MEKEEILSSLEIFLSVNSGDKRLITSLKKSIENLFDSYSANVPFESLSINELREKRDRLLKNLNNIFITDAVKSLMKKKIVLIEKRIEDLS